MTDLIRHFPVWYKERGLPKAYKVYLARICILQGRMWKSIV